MKIQNLLDTDIFETAVLIFYLPDPGFFMTDKPFEPMDRWRFTAFFLPFALFYAMCYLQRTAVPGTSFNYFQQTFGLSAGQVSGLSASLIYIYAFCQPFAGFLADKYSGTRVFTVAGAIFCVGACLFPFCGGNVFLMYSCRFLIGLGSSGVYLSLLAELGRFCPRDKFSVFYGIFAATGYVGGLCGTLPFSVLCQHFDCLDVLKWCGGISLAFYLVFQLTKYVMPVAEIRNRRFSLLPLLEILKTKTIWLPIFGVSVIFGCYSLIQMVFGVKFLQDFAGLTAIAASRTIFFQTIVSIMSLILSGFTLRWLKNRRKPLMIFGSVITFTANALLLFAVICHLPGPFFTIACLLFAAASGVAMSFVMTIMEMNRPENMAASAGLANAFEYLFVAVFSVAAGKLLDSFVAPELFRSGVKVIYPENAYVTLFALMLIPSSLGVLGTFFIPETNGKYALPNKSNRV